MKIVVCSGGFDPCHSGHIEFLKDASKLGDKLIVALNSDEWLKRKKGRAFMPTHERVSIIENLKMVDGVILFNDNDDTAIEAIKNVQKLFPADQIIFANGGDRTKDNIPEMIVSDVDFVFGVGGENKKNSSSWVLEEWKSPKTERVWGHYRVLYEVEGTKVKELTVMPGQNLSMQRHQYRSEHWHVAEGSAVVRSPTAMILPVICDMQVKEISFKHVLNTHDEIKIPVGCWHQLINSSDQLCKIIEIQCGEKCVEEDIERK